MSNTTPRAIAVFVETLTSDQIESLRRILCDIPGIWEQPRTTSDRRLVTACFSALEYHDRKWILDSRYREAATLICATINARAPRGG